MSGPLVRNLAALLAHRVDGQPDDPAFTFLENGESPSETMTWRELDLRSRSIAAVLARHAATGDRVLLAYPSGLEFLAAFFGCQYASAIAVPVPLPRSARQTAAVARFHAILADASPAVVLTAPRLAPLVEQLCRERSSCHAMHAPVVLAPAGGQNEFHRRGTARDCSGLASGSEAIAFLQYTSGSTSSPRGVMVTQGNVLHNLAAARALSTPGRVEASVSWLPVTHDMGLVEGLLQPVLRGHHAVLLPPAAFLQRPVRWLRAIAAYRAARSGAPNFAYDLCARRVADEDLDALDLSCWRDAYNGAEFVRHDTLAAFATRFRRAGFQPSAFRPCYGLAEATLLVASGRWDGSKKGLASCNTPAPDTVFAIVDPVTHERCAPGAIGEIWVSGPGVARGYWGPAARSAGVFGARLAGDSRGYLRTGDLGRLDVDGLHITGRIKDVLIVRGQKHFPVDLEMTAAAVHPAAAPFGVAAFAAGTGIDGDRIVIAIETDRHWPWQGEGPDAVIAAVRDAVVANHGVALEDVILLPPRALPRTTSGKLQRYLCRDRWREGRLLRSEVASVS